MTVHAEGKPVDTQRLAVNVIPMDNGHVAKIIDVHMASFQGFFLTFLGPAFLRQLYAGALDEPAGFGFVAEGGRGVCGFVIGTARPSGFYRRLLRRRWWRIALATALPILRRPRIIPRLIRALSASEKEHEAGRATLMSIAVLPDAQGKGIGRALVRTFLEEAARRGLCRVDLTTDHEENEAVNRFYRDLGFVRARTFATAEGRMMNEYVIDC